MKQYTDIINLLQEEFNEFFPNRFEVCGEQDFLTGNTLDPSKIYCVVKFSSASLNYGTISMPATLQFLGMQDEAMATKALLLNFAADYNLTTISVNDNIFIQAFTAPTVMMNFSEIDNGFRQLYYMSAEFNQAQGVNYIGDLVYIKNEKEYPVKYLTLSFSLNNANNSQPTYGANGLTSTIIKYGTFTMGISLYFDNSELTKDCLTQIQLVENIGDYTVLNTTFNFQMKFAGSNSTLNVPLKLLSAECSQAVAGLPTLTVSFVR